MVISYIQQRVGKRLRLSDHFCEMWHIWSKNTRRVFFILPLAVVLDLEMAVSGREFGQSEDTKKHLKFHFWILHVL